jgi:transcription-repair coupling factor (superfamily II helicase)
MKIIHPLNHNLTQLILANSSDANNQQQAKDTKVVWRQLNGSSVALAIATLAQQRQAPLIVITKDLNVATRLNTEIAFFLNNNHGATGNSNNNSTVNASDSTATNHSPLPLLSFPDWETLPYDHFSPHQDLTSQRLATLYQLPSLKHGVLITAINTLMQRLPPRTYIEHNTFLLKRGDQLDITTLRHNLERQGYHCVNKVMEHGEFAVRGSLIDLFPMGSDQPYRIDLFGNQVDTIRTFDPETQITVSKTDAINLLPAKEFPLTDEAISRFRHNWRSTFAINPTNCPIYQSISNGESAGGIEYYLPLFFPELSTLCNYLPPASLVILVDDVYHSANNFWDEIKHRHNELRHDTTRPLLLPPAIFTPVEEIFAALKQFQQVNVNIESSQHNQENSAAAPSANVNTFNTAVLPTLTIDHKASTHQPLAKLAAFTKSFDGNILFCAESRGRLETTLELLRPLNIVPQLCNHWQEFVNTVATTAATPHTATTTTTQLHPQQPAQSKYYITIGSLEQGFVLSAATAPAAAAPPQAHHAPAVAVVSEADLFGEQLVLQRRYRTQHKKYKYADPENIIRDLIELRIGAPVVHIEHGVGRYLGLQTITSEGIAAEFLVIEYANNAKLYVPIASLHLISRYTGGGEDPNSVHYNTLGSEKWSKAKQQALKKIRDIAAELLALYAKRAARPGFVYQLPQQDYHKFTELFPFEETPDQQEAINAVIGDMTAERHMDRLICGDVGFGKTEVAMRAAFIAAINNKQVVVLVPTTILAQQHYLNFKDRFADWPFNIELISRFRTAKEQQAILERLAAGKIDIIIGTHKLLQPSIKLKDLGLLIIDEEHRFGVKQKERIKALRPDVDLLTLTATPIPRTLNMAFAGIRDFSIIATPPARRLAIKTFIHERDAAIIREAIWREVLRGGQVYFLHNDIASIEKVAQELQQLIPTIRVAVAHGQMREHQLERIMSDFYHLRFNVLVCTTIIESGIDVPTTNTIIIDRADHFGLAQLHQLRGRVGRSHHQAYAYLLVPHKKALTPDAERRLDAIASMEDLGAGFNLATHDLEIRGAGELLGAEQSGHIETIGFTLYMEYLEEAIATLKTGRELPAATAQLEDILRLEEKHAEMEVKVAALFPDEYIGDINQRLTLYKRLANAQNDAEIGALKEEIIDRFGTLPPASHNLFKITQLKLRAEQLGIKKIIANASGGTLFFTAAPKIEPTKIIALIQQQPQSYQLRGPSKLLFNYNKHKAPTPAPAIQNHPTASTQPDASFILNFIEQLLQRL